EGREVEIIAADEGIVCGVAPAGGDLVLELLRKGGEELAIAGEGEADAVTPLRVGVGGAGLQELDQGVAGCRHPLPSPPHKGEGARRCIWLDRATATGGWEGGRAIPRLVQHPQDLHRRLRG